MFERLLKEETLFIIKEIEANPKTTQRSLSVKLGISLGKTNYLIKYLIQKDFIKIRNSSYSSGKIQKIHYYLTKAGLERKMRLTQDILKRKEAEYLTIKNDWDKFSINRLKQSAI